MKIVFIGALCTVLYSCTNSSNTGSTRKDTLPKPVTVEDLRKAEPQFPGFYPQKLNILDTMRYLRVILNGNKLVKTWMVYFDRVKRKWNTLTWQGKGDRFTILVDTVFNQQVGIENDYADPPTFYMAESADEGKTWQPLDMSPVPLPGCPHPTLKGHHKMAQLLISNDFPNDTHLPSLCIAWQWNHLVNLVGRGPATALDVSPFCQAVQELSRNR